jgi:hypothetical protein
MDRGIKLACSAVLLGATLALAACSGTGAGNQVASCKGGYPDGGGIKDMSPYSPNAGSFQPDCEGRY